MEFRKICFISLLFGVAAEKVYLRDLDKYSINISSTWHTQPSCQKGSRWNSNTDPLKPKEVNFVVCFSPDCLLETFQFDMAPINTVFADYTFESRYCIAKEPYACTEFFDIGANIGDKRYTNDNIFTSTEPWVRVPSPQDQKYTDSSNPEFFIASGTVAINNKGKRYISYIFNSRDICGSLKSFSVYYYKCPTLTESLIIFDEHNAPNKTKSVEIYDGRCVANAVKVNGSEPMLRCMWNGTYETIGRCQCAPGFEKYQNICRKVSNPTNVTYERINVTTITLKWFAPKFYLHLITSYEIECQSGDNSTLTISTIELKKEHVYPLNKQYRCKVRAMMTPKVIGSWSDYMSFNTSITSFIPTVNMKNSRANAHHITHLQCNIIGYVGVRYGWRLGNKLLMNDTIYKLLIIKRQEVSANQFNYESRLTIYPNISKYITNNSDVKCLMDGFDYKATCYLDYTCLAYYTEERIAESTRSVAFENFDVTVGTPIFLNATVGNNSITFGWINNQTVGEFPVIYSTAHLIDTKTKQALYKKTFSIDEEHMITVSNLVPYQNYTAKIVSLNRFYVTSNEAIKHFQTAEGVPSKVTQLKQTSSTQSSISLSWLPPDQPNGKLSNYIVEYGDVNSTVLESILVGTTYVQITGLKPFTEYKIRIRASTKNNNLLGPWSSFFVRNTRQGVAEAAKNLQIVFEKDPNTALLLKGKLTWDTPKLNGRLIYYKVKISGKKAYMDEFKHVLNYQTNIKQVTMDGLYPGTEYEIEVSVVTEGGEGKKAVLFQTTDVGAPFAANTSLSMKTMKGQVVFINRIKEYTGKILHYSFAVGQTKCFEDPLYTTNITFNGNHQKFEAINIPKGIRPITMSGNRSFTLDLIGKFKFCSRAVVFNNKTDTLLHGKSVHVEIDREDLEGQNQPPAVTESTVTIKLPKGPQSTQAYIVVVNPKRNSKLPIKPSDLTGYRMNYQYVPYISAVLDQTFDSFVVGDGRTFDNPLFNRQKRSLNTLETFDNVPLEPEKDYSILVMAYVDEKTFYTTPWLIVKTSPDSSEIKADSSKTAMVGGSIGGLVGLILIVTVIFIYRRRQSQLPDTDEKQTEETFKNNVTHVYESIDSSGNAVKQNKEKENSYYQAHNNIPLKEVATNEISPREKQKSTNEHQEICGPDGLYQEMNEKSIQIT